MQIKNWKLFVEKKFQEKHDNQNNIKVINWPAIQGYGWQTFYTMTLEKKQETNGITISCFLYGNLWRILWFACKVNLGHYNETCIEKFVLK